MASNALNDLQSGREGQQFLCFYGSPGDSALRIVQCPGASDGGKADPLRTSSQLPGVARARVGRREPAIGIDVVDHHDLLARKRADAKPLENSVVDQAVEWDTFGDPL